MGAMGWRTTGDVAEFLSAAGEYLRAERARNTVILTVTATMQSNPALYNGRPGTKPDAKRMPLLGWWTGPAGEIDGAFLHTPPFPLLLTAVPRPAAAHLALALARRPLAGVNADPAVAEAFAGSWRDATGCGARVHRRQRLYRLAGLSWPEPAVDGASRAAAGSDAALLVDWLTAFTREVGDMGSREDHAAAVSDRLSYQGVTVWEAGGVPVSIAGRTRQVAGMVRVGPVYTPPELRGHGYASAATAAVSQQALDAGASEVLLFTDLANPVSNSIYQRIGYRAVEDRTVLAFQEMPAIPAELRGFTRNGRLTQIPARHTKRLLLLDFISQSFEPGRRYSEAEVNAVLRALHDDHAALRRYLVDEDFLSREDGFYWRSGGTVDI
jgi:hypothetical protein